MNAGVRNAEHGGWWSCPVLSRITHIHRKGLIDVSPQLNVLLAPQNLMYSEVF